MQLPQPFPSCDNPVAPDPSNLLAPSLRQPPIPTNAFWQNFILNRGTSPEYIHPYLIKSERGALSISYPSRVVQPHFIYQAFVPDLTITSGSGSTGEHSVIHFDDLSVTLQFPGSMSAPLVRGCPYVTCIFDAPSSCLHFSSIHAVVQLLPNEDRTKHKVLLNNGQTWLIYSSEPLALGHGLALTGAFRGVIRVALLPGDHTAETILDRFSSVYPIEGRADMSTPFRLTYEWKKHGCGRLLMLSLPIHREIMSSPSPERSAGAALVYKSMDGDMHPVFGDSWVLNEAPIPASWYSSKGIPGEHLNEVAEKVRIDVASLTKITTPSTYFFGKAVARAARLALIAEEVHAFDVLQRIRDFLRDALTPWMEGEYPGNAFLYDEKWGGLTSRQGSRDGGADFGFGIYNDHHYHLGYFCYAGAVLAKLDPAWGQRYRTHLYTLVEDYMTDSHHLHPLVIRSRRLFPRFRNFDFWLLHSWAGGLTEFGDGRNQESTSEAVNAYYSAALLGLVFGDSYLVNTGLTLTAFEIRAARMLWHMPSDCTLYEPSFVANFRVIGVLWANKRDTNLWFGNPEWKECKLGIQVLPILPVTELLFQDIGYAKELVDWTWPALSRPDIHDGWKGFIYALQALYAPEAALKNVSALKGHDDGNSLSNMLWWIYSRWTWE